MSTTLAPMLPSSYTPQTTLGRRTRCKCGAYFIHPTMIGRLPLLGPCCKPAESNKPRRMSPTPRFTARELIAHLGRPGWAHVSFPGGISLFVREHHFKADTITLAVGMAIDAGMLASGATD
jgi:hypothetical protein